MPNNDLKFRLSQLSSLKGELRLLEDQELRLREQLFDVNQKVKFDSVHGSSPDWPYVLHSIPVRGMRDDDLSAKADIKGDIAEIKAKIHEQQNKCAREYKRLIGFIASVDDSRIRQILMLKYIDGIEHWNDIAAKMGSSESKDSVRVAHDRFLKKFS